MFGGRPITMILLALWASVLLASWPLDHRVWLGALLPSATVATVLVVIAFRRRKKRLRVLPKREPDSLRLDDDENSRDFYVGARIPRDELPDVHRSEDYYDPGPRSSATDDLISGPERSAEPSSQLIDRHVRFTVYRPDRAKPVVWNTLLAFAYRGADPEEGGADIRESYMEVERQATV